MQTADFHEPAVPIIIYESRPLRGFNELKLNTSDFYYKIYQR